MQFVLLSYELLKPFKKMKIASKTSSSEVSRYCVIFYWLFRILQFKNHAYFFCFGLFIEKKIEAWYLCKLKQLKNASITTASPALHACSVPEDHFSLSPHASLFASSHVHISSQYRLPERSFHGSHFSKAFRDAVWAVL